MARSCGIRLGRRGFEIVVLDGGPRKSRLVDHVVGELPPGAEEDVGEIASALRDAVKDRKIPTDSVGLVVDTGLAAFRGVRVPFADHAKIDEVIKYEIESRLPQWNIDDVVVDFVVLSSSAVESNLIVTAVPKSALAPRIAACEKAGMEPLEVELEATAMVNAAHHGGLLDPETACVLVHFGESSTSVVVIDGGDVKSMRAIHSGALPLPAPASAAREGADDEEAPEVSEADAFDPLAHEAHLEEVLTRLKRELRRTISAASTEKPVEAVYVCGHPAPGLAGDRILDVPIEVLEVLPGGGGEEPERPGRLFVAWGAALRQLGAGILRPSLRREELRFLGKFERLELPLAVLGLLLVTIFSVSAIITHKQIAKREADLTLWQRASNLHMLGEPEKGTRGNLGRPPERVLEYARNAVEDDVAQDTTLAQLQTIDGMLQEEILDLQRRMGRDVTLTQPMSAMESLTLVLGVFEELSDRLGQYSIRRAEADYIAGKGGRDDQVLVKLDLTFRGADTIEATRRYEDFIDAVQSKGWYLDHSPVKESTLETEDGIYVDGLRITMDPTRVEYAQS